LGAKVQADLNAARILVNSLNDDNFEDDADIRVASIDVAGAVTLDEIHAPSGQNIVATMISFTGVKFRVVNSDGDILFEVQSDGTVCTGQYIQHVPTLELNIVPKAVTVSVS